MKNYKVQLDPAPDMTKIILGDMNAKIGKEQEYKPTIGRKSLHDNQGCNEYVATIRYSAYLALFPNIWSG